MAVLYISEYAQLSGGREGSPTEPAIATQTVAIGGTSAQSSAFNTATRFVRIHTDAICSIAFGANPTASATKARMAAGQTEYYSVTPGHKVAVITNT